ncbi:MAG: class 1 fructose-bisphosphatase [Gemmatimonadota bacterium]
MSESKVVTLGRHIADQERVHPEATGAFSDILYDIALAAKIISRDVNKAGLVDILGRAGGENIQGEVVQKLDALAQDVIYNAMDHSGNLCCMVSEEVEDIIPIPRRYPRGDYVLLFDPLDGSSNIDVNVSIGTIFSIHAKISDGVDGVLEDALQPGRRQLAAGYVVYGSSTMLVFTSGNGVHGFTLDPSIGEFLLSHPNIRLPEPPAPCYSINEAYYPRWSRQQQLLVSHLKGTDGYESQGFSSRYIGSLVADFHRTVLAGGLFMYPSDNRSPSGKLRLLYEAAPLAMVAEQAGGRASTGNEDILDILPDSLHQRIPLFIGSKELVDLAERYLAGEGEEPVDRRRSSSSIRSDGNGKGNVGEKDATRPAERGTARTDDSPAEAES